MNFEENANANHTQRFVPPAARLNGTIGIIAGILAIASTAFSWLLFETAHPGLAAAVGGIVGISVFVGVHWYRRKRCPPTLLVTRTGVVFESKRECVLIPWSDLKEIREVVTDGECLEFRQQSSEQPVVFNVEHFSTDQVNEIKSRLLGP